MSIYCKIALCPIYCILSCFTSLSAVCRLLPTNNRPNWFCPIDSVDVRIVKNDKRCSRIEFILFICVAEGSRCLYLYIRRNPERLCVLLQARRPCSGKPGRWSPGRGGRFGCHPVKFFWNRNDHIAFWREQSRKTNVMYNIGGPVEFRVYSPT